MDDGNGGAYVSKVGSISPYLMPTYTVSSGLTKGSTYRFRYRAKNCQGWGPFSSDLYVTAASVPSAPPAPSVSSVSSTAIALHLYPTINNGGSAVTDYELYRNTGTDGSTFS